MGRWAPEKAYKIHDFSPDVVELPDYPINSFRNPHKDRDTLAFIPILYDSLINKSQHVLVYCKRGQV